MCDFYIHTFGTLLVLWSSCTVQKFSLCDLGVGGGWSTYGDICVQLKLPLTNQTKSNHLLCCYSWYILAMPANVILFIFFLPVLSLMITLLGKFLWVWLFPGAPSFTKSTVNVHPVDQYIPLATLHRTQPFITWTCYASSLLHTCTVVKQTCHSDESDVCYSWSQKQ